MMLPDSLQLQYRPDLGVLTARWMAETSPADYQAEYGAVLAAGHAHGTQRWLLDIRRRPSPTNETTYWVTHDWLPQAAAALAPARLRLAYLLSPIRTETIRADADLQSTINNVLAPNHSYDLRLFGDEGEAVRWLLS